MALQKKELLKELTSLYESCEGNTVPADMLPGHPAAASEKCHKAATVS